ncbi:hypothetical protein [Bacillus wiedmannii]|uniref:hypothetical protein n=1 Tax=Bacillus wiedmannii TaxID=1890302 RepID=UPI000BF395B0|nr:hypothetical protein [Bacillus wiedmannii]PEP15499.1 hypothetical protein CN552_12565 [Bacillus wiedmannii]
MSMQTRNKIMIGALIFVGILVIIFPPSGIISIPLGLFLKGVLYPKDLEEVMCFSCQSKTVVRGRPNACRCSGCRKELNLNWNTEPQDEDLKEVTCGNCNVKRSVSGHPKTFTCNHCKQSTRLVWGNIVTCHRCGTKTEVAGTPENCTCRGCKDNMKITWS